jgi:hypothetical protein
MSDHEKRPGLGDDQGTRVGRPTGAGAEAAEGIHSADGDPDPSDRTALEGKETGREAAHGKQGRSGSEPIESNDTAHQSGYGGGGVNGGSDDAHVHRDRSP